MTYANVSVHIFDDCAVEIDYSEPIDGSAYYTVRFATSHGPVATLFLSPEQLTALSADISAALARFAHAA